MNYAFKRSSEVFLVVDGVGYAIPTLSDFSMTQTLSEKTLYRRNQFSRLAPKKIINRVKNVGNGSLEFYYSKNCKIFPIIMETMDFERNYAGRLEFNNNFLSRPKSIYIIIKNGDRFISIPGAFVTNVDIGSSPTSINSIVVGFEYSYSIEDLITPIIFQEAITPIYQMPSYIDFKIGNTQINSVKTAAFTITRSINWLSEGANQFNLGMVASANNVVVTDYNISATATANDNMPNDIVRHLLPNTQDIRLGNPALYLELSKANITTRKSVDDIFTVSFDIKHQSLLPVVLGGTYEY